MKISLSILAGALMLASGGAFAQSCASPIVVNGGSTVTGDTCTGANELGTVCIFGQSPANDIIYQINVTVPYTATVISLINSTPAWNAAMELITTTCSGNSTCPRNADSNGPGGNEAMDVTNLPAGTYFLAVNSTNADPGCGSYQLGSNGSFPVMLQSFDVS